MSAVIFAAQAPVERVARGPAGTCVPSQRLRMQQLAFGSSSRIAPVYTRTADVSAQRAAVVAQAYPAATASDDQFEEEDDSFSERVIQVRRVTKVVKGGKQLSFRAVVSTSWDRQSEGMCTGQFLHLIWRILIYNHALLLPIRSWLATRMALSAWVATPPRTCSRR